jgi:hypothetical protein
MHSRDYRDIIAGALLMLVGIYAAAVAVTTLDLGTLRVMGPGMFPAALGCLIAITGLLILVPALLRKGHMPRVDLRSALAILISILAFSLMVRPFGIVPSVVVQVLIASRADGKLTVVGTLAVALALALVTTLIFQKALGVPLAVAAWPW